ncbi:hypothetical protein ACB092_10G077500 [Castanea dentata]
MVETNMTPGTKRIAVVTGANKGIGYGICQQLASNGVKAVLTARDVKRGNEAVDKLKTAGYSDVVFRQLDVTDPVSISPLLDFIKTQFGKLDILKRVNPNSPMRMRIAMLGTSYSHKELIPLLQLSNSARIVNVSSGLGQLKFISNENARKKLGDVDGLTEEKVDEVVEGFLEDVKKNSIEVKGWPINFSAYVVSKAALNAYTRVLAQKNPNIAINSVGPGYTKTDLNDNTGVFTIVEAAKGPAMLALIPEGGPSGLFFDQTEVSTF